MSLGKYLKSKREKAELSQAQVAKKLGYTTPQFISNWERDISCPPINALKKLGTLYGISAEELFDVRLKAAIDEVTLDLKRRFASSKAA